MRLEGVITPLLTPVTGRDGEIDDDELASLVHFLVDYGVDAVFPCGSSGEFTSLTPEQRKTVIEVVAEASSVPVLAGCGDTSLRGIRAQVEHASEVNADAAVIVTPYYFSTTQESLCEFFEHLADTAELPIVLYDIPGLTDRRLSCDSIRRLSEHENIVGVKDSSGDLSRFNRILSATPRSFSVLQGSTLHAIPSLDLGANGIVSGEANVFPGMVSELYEAHTGGRRERALRNMFRIYELDEIIGVMPQIPALKHLTNLAGHDLGPPVWPLPTLDEQQKEALKAGFEDITLRIDEAR